MSDSPGILTLRSQINLNLTKRATNNCNTKAKLQFNVCSLKNLTPKKLLAKALESYFLSFCIDCERRFFECLVASDTT